MLPSPLSSYLNCIRSLHQNKSAQVQANPWNTDSLMHIIQAKIENIEHIDWADSMLYHLIISTHCWSIEPASNLSVNAVNNLQPEAAFN